MQRLKELIEETAVLMKLHPHLTPAAVAGYQQTRAIERLARATETMTPLPVYGNVTGLPEAIANQQAADAQIQSSLVSGTLRVKGKR